jgi:hypothetical protein
LSGSDVVCFDPAEHFEKMSYRNRYYIPGANGLINLSVPLVNGRNQRTVMKDIKIFNKDRWQVQHWRTIISVYNRSPYFDHYESSLEQLFHSEYIFLTDFNLATIHWLKEKLNVGFNEILAEAYKEQYDETITDLRDIKPGHEKKTTAGFPRYVQMFSERNGFLPDLSMLDLLFSEGPYAMKWITSNKSQITY